MVVGALAMTEGAALSRPLTPDEARSLTDEVKRDAHLLWEKLLRLYEGGAHTALSYSSWGAYYKAEFQESEVRGYQLLQAGRTVKRLTVNPELTVVSSGLPLPTSERQVRALAKAPEDIQPAIWREVVETAPEGGVTAAHVAEVVAGYVETGADPSAERAPGPQSEDAGDAEPEQTPGERTFWRDCDGLERSAARARGLRSVFGNRLFPHDLTQAEVRRLTGLVESLSRVLGNLESLGERLADRKVSRGGEPMEWSAEKNRTSPDEQFREFHKANPDVYNRLRDEALRRVQDGEVRLSIKLLIEWLRADAPDSSINNSHTGHYARLLMEREPALRGRFVTRGRGGH